MCRINWKLWNGIMSGLVITLIVGWVIFGIVVISNHNKKDTGVTYEEWIKTLEKDYGKDEVKNMQRQAAENIRSRYGR